MHKFWISILWQQFGAAIDMLENAIRDCPAEVWSDPTHPPAWQDNDVVGFWYVAYHTLFFLDYCFSESVENFSVPAPFSLDELDPAGLLPPRPFTKDETLGYLQHCHAKCRAAINALTEESARRRCVIDYLDLSVAEMYLYNMRHVQHHVAQLNLILRQKTASAPKWVKTAKLPLAGV